MHSFEAISGMKAISFLMPLSIKPTAFFFTTSAAAQYQAKYGDPVRARLHIDWMMHNANLYGLMPERIYLNGSGCSQASPLSWCCAEFAAALLEWQKALEK